MPWQLGRNDKRKEYEAQGSSFVRNIHNKAQQMSESAARTNKKYQEVNYNEDDVTEGLGPNFDWKKVVASQYPQHRQAEKSSSAGNTQRRQRQPKPVPKKRFDSNRLLHPYQRELAAMRRGDALEDDVEEAPVAMVYQPPKPKPRDDVSALAAHQYDHGITSVGE
jgi:hypothetical protein